VTIELKSVHGQAVLHVRREYNVVGGRRHLVKDLTHEGGAGRPVACVVDAVGHRSLDDEPGPRCQGVELRHDM
jgi:hypothetical protein